MFFNISIANQSVDVEHFVKKYFYKKIYETIKFSKCNKTWIRFTGFGIGVVSCLITIAKRIGLIIEPIIKGLIHLFGSFFHKDCKLTTALQFLFFNALGQAVCLLPCSCIAVFQIGTKILGTAFSPNTYIYGLWTDHDKEEKEGCINRPKVAKFNKAIGRIKKDPNNVVCLKELGECYSKGYGVAADENTAISYYMKAANQNDAEAMRLIGIALDKDERELGMEWLKKAAELGDVEALYLLGVKSYENKRVIDAGGFFEKAMKKGHVLAQERFLQIMNEISAELNKIRMPAL